MKHILLAALFLPSVLIAQSSQPVPKTLVQPAYLGEGFGAPLPDNYQIVLTLTDKDRPPVEIAVVVASTQFTASIVEPDVRFAGTVTIVESGGLLVGYSLGLTTPIPRPGNDALGSNRGAIPPIPTTVSTQYKPSAIQGSVRLKAGEEIQIIHAGTLTASLSIKKIEAPKPK